jgi:hypothetical protein
VAAVSNAASDDGSDVAESATGATMAIAVINWYFFHSFRRYEFK